MFSRIAAGALLVCALTKVPAAAHSPYTVPGKAAAAESHTYALTFDVGE